MGSVTSMFFFFFFLSPPLFELPASINSFASFGSDSQARLQRRQGLLLVCGGEQGVCRSGSFIPGGKNYHIKTLIPSKNNLCDSDEEGVRANKLQLASPRFVSSALFSRSCSPGGRHPAEQECRGEKHQLNQNSTSPSASKRRPDALLSWRFFDLQASCLRPCPPSRLHLPSPLPPGHNRGLIHY